MEAIEYEAAEWHNGAPPYIDEDAMNRIDGGVAKVVEAVNGIIATGGGGGFPTDVEGGHVGYETYLANKASVDAELERLGGSVKAIEDDYATGTALEEAVAALSEHMTDSQFLYYSGCTDVMPEDWPDGWLTYEEEITAQQPQPEEPGEPGETEEGGGDEPTE